MYEQDIFSGYGVEIKLNKPDDFLKIRESLTRIGVEGRKSSTLFQSCHILHKRGRYAILHFKELFLMDGKQSDLCDNDIERRNTIVRLLNEWNMLTVVDPQSFAHEPMAPMTHIKVIAYRDKENWVLEPKYNIGVKSAK